MFPVINLGPLAIQSYGLIIVLGIWGGLAWAEKLATRHALDGDQLYTIVFLFGGSGLVGARLAYSLIHPNLFTGHWLDLFSLSLRMMDWASGLLVAFIAVMSYIQRKKIPVFALLDSLVPFFLILNLAIAIATLANQTAVGAPTTMPWGIQVYQENRHPVQVYHLIMAVFLLACCWPVPEQWLGIKRNMQTNGLEFSIFLMAFALGFAVVQTFRLDYPIAFLNINTYHLLSMGLFGLGIWLNQRVMIDSVVERN